MKIGNQGNMTACETLLVYVVICLFIIFTTAPCLLPKILRNLCFQFFLDTFIRVVPREIEVNGYAKLLEGKQGALWSQ